MKSGVGGEMFDFLQVIIDSLSALANTILGVVNMVFSTITYIPTLLTAVNNYLGIWLVVLPGALLVPFIIVVGLSVLRVVSRFV